MGKKYINTQRSNSISETTKVKIRKEWELQVITNTDIMEKYNISHYNFYKLISTWNCDKQGGSTIMSHPNYTTENDTGFKPVFPAKNILLADVEDPNIFINKLKRSQAISQQKVDNFNKKNNF